MTAGSVLIIGQGALGAATAWNLARNGATDVHLVDRSTPPQGTTPRGAGLITPLVQDPADVGLVQRSQRLLDELARSHQDVTIHRCGGLLIAGPPHASLTRRLERMWKAHDVPVQRAKPHHVQDLPGLESIQLDGSEHAIYSPHDAWASPPRIVQAMLDDATQHGARRTQARIQRVDADGAHTATHDTLTADRIVLAAGAWTPHLLPDTTPIPLQAYRAQAARIDPGGQTPDALVHDAVHGTYWRPDGPHLVAGNGTDLDPHDPTGTPEPDPAFASSLALRLRERIPEAQPRPEDAWAGFEAGTPDTRPLVGSLEDLPSVTVCAGGNGFGFMRALALGEIAAHQVLGRAPPLPASAYRLDRFKRPGDPFPLREGFALGGEEP